MNLIHTTFPHAYLLSYLHITNVNCMTITFVIYILITFVITIKYAMKERLITFLQTENKSYAQFAEEIGVQASGISHILSGRNRPSLDFVLKMLTRYPSLSTDWLLFGRGPVYRNVPHPTLFDVDPDFDIASKDSIGETPSAVTGGIDSSLQAQPQPQGDEQITSPRVDSLSGISLSAADGLLKESVSKSREVTRIVIFYSDKRFTEYLSD